MKQYVLETFGRANGLPNNCSRVFFSLFEAREHFKIAEAQANINPEALAVILSECEYGYKDVVLERWPK